MPNYSAIKSELTSWDLAACPMCGGAAQLTKGVATEEVWPYGDFYRVFCGKCQLRQLFYRTAAESVLAWNSRFAPDLDDQAAGKLDGGYE